MEWPQDERVPAGETANDRVKIELVTIELTRVGRWEGPEREGIEDVVGAGRRPRSVRGFRPTRIDGTRRARVRQGPPGGLEPEISLRAPPAAQRANLQWGEAGTDEYGDGASG